MQFKRIGRCFARRFRVGHSGQQRGVFAAKLQDMVQHGCDARFAVGAGHSNQRQRAVRVAEKAAAKHGVCLAGIGHTVAAGQRFCRDNSRSAGGERLAQQLLPVAEVFALLPAKGPVGSQAAKAADLLFYGFSQPVYLPVQNPVAENVYLTSSITLSSVTGEPSL